MKTQKRNQPASDSAKALPNEGLVRDPLTEIIRAEQLEAAKIPGFYNDEGWDGVLEPSPTPRQLSPAEEAEGDRLLDEYFEELDRRDHLIEIHKEESIEDREHDRNGSDPSPDEIAAIKEGLRRIRTANRNRNQSFDLPKGQTP